MTALLRRVGCALCAVILLFVVSCSESASNGQTTTSSSVDHGDNKEYVLTLPYCAKDVLNPYTAQTKQNQELSHLLYDPLVKASQTFEPVFFLAENITQEGKTLTVTLRSASFTDGAPITSDDVVYSLTQARGDGSLYAAKLHNIDRVYALDSKTVVVEIKHTDPRFTVNLDCPIIRMGTADLKDANRLPLPPVGCGRYTLKNDGDVYSLVSNPSYYRGTVGLTEIRLSDCPDDDALNHQLSIGLINMVYSDLSRASVPKMAGATTPTVSTSLVYLGANGRSRLTGDSRVRQAVSFALNRDALCQDAFFGYAQPATGLFHPDWAPVEQLESIGTQPNDQLTVAYLEELGYNRLDDRGYRINASGERLKLQLLFNEENTARSTAADRIKTQLKRFGIDVKVQSVPFEEYRRRLQNGQFDLYLGEVRLPNSMDVYSLFNEPDIVYGIPSDSQARAAFNAYYAGESDLLNAVSAFVSEMPFLPLCYRNGVILSSETVKQMLSYSPSDLFNGIEQLQ